MVMWDLQEQEAGEEPTGNRKEQGPSSSRLVILLQCPLLAKPQRVPTSKGEMWLAESLFSTIKPNIVWWV